MSDETPRVYGGGSPAWGQRLAGPADRPTAITFPDGLTPATDEHRLRVARTYFIETRPEDFQADGKAMIDKATGKRYRVATFDPVLQDDPQAGGVEVFLISDGWILYLAPEGYQQQERRGPAATIKEERVG